MWLNVIFPAIVALASGTPAGNGLIEGVVIRAIERTPVPRAEVILRVKIDGQWQPVAETTADAQGKFRFEHLPANGTYVYLPGANRDGIHYPGTNICLTSLRPHAEVKLAVHDAVAFPNPLVVRRHTITLSPEPGLLRVTESILIDNPTTASYVGQTTEKDAQPVTLQLAIPSDFEQVTFKEEFFGRRFAIISGRLTTGIPWPPGQRELTFSYVLRNQQGHYVWERPLDLPSSNINVSVQGDRSEKITCNLDRAARQKSGQIVFESISAALPAGHPLRVELGDLPFSAMAYASWGAVSMLIGLIVATSAPWIARRKKTSIDLEQLRHGIDRRQCDGRNGR
jgi:hypothetical protein